MTDPSIYMGTGGIVFALQKVSQFLKHDEMWNTGSENIQIDTEPEEETKEERKSPGGYNYDMLFDKY